MTPQRGACASIPGHEIRSLVAVICDNYLMEVANLAMVGTKLQKRSLNQLTISRERPLCAEAVGHEPPFE
jgi:hypothetical protein